MPQDIFISYSSKDREKADQLSELLASAGLSVWIDRSGIAGAEQWATEIVEGIKSCSTFLLLVSPHSIESENVLRELSLASEKHKRVLPVDIEPITLPSSFEYPLAGLQRVPFAEFDRIVHSHKHGVEKIIKKDTRKSLMILPFEDLSPTGDNGWFADGIVSELISALSNVKSIRIADNQSTKEFKQYHGQLTTYAREMNFRYFVQGDVRKFGDQIKISSRLLDIETGDHLWQDSMKGTMENIFDFQEEVALKVVEGLKVHLESDEKKRLAERGTEKVEAYELFLKANEYFSLHTHDGLRLALQQITQAAQFDPNYATALGFKASTLAALYRGYDRDPSLLDEAEQLAKRALEIKPDLFQTYDALSLIYRFQNRLQEAEATAKEYVLRAPQKQHSHFCLAFFYAGTNQPDLAIAPYEKALELQPADLATNWNLVLVSDRAHQKERAQMWARVALPHYERRLRLVPDDKNARVEYANLLRYTGDPNRVVEALEPLLKMQDLDGAALYNIACIYATMNETEHALDTLRRSVKAGFRNVDIFRTDSDLDELREMDEFKEILESLRIKNYEPGMKE
jgi:adenylate cyclase